MPGPRDETPEALLRAGFELHRKGDLAGALARYRQVLRKSPRNADALHLSGLVAHARGDAAAAVASISKAVALAPANVDFLTNLAAACLAAGTPAEALAAADRALARKPASIAALAARGSALAALERADEAAQAFRAAIALDPAAPDALNNLANLEQRRGRIDEAIPLYERVLASAPGHIQAHSNYGTALYALYGRGGADAARAREKASAWHAAHPDNPMARHWFASLNGAAVPARAGDDYVRNAFDMFAPTFERTLAGLGYRGPALVGERLERLVGPPAGALAVLDIGCGTGLAGPVLRPWARTLDGVDISPGMLARARAGGVYDALREAELTADMRAHPRAYDLIVGADVFVYFGDLGALCADAANCLRADGTLLFMVEAIDPAQDDPDLPWTVRPSGRYAHSRAHILASLAGAGLTETLFDEASFRQESKTALPGYVVAAKLSRNRPPRCAARCRSP